MRVHELPNESLLLGYPVIRLGEWHSCQEVIEYAEAVKKKHVKMYLYTELNATGIADINRLEAHGFQFSEFRIQLLLDMNDMDDYSKAFYPLKADLITTEKHFRQATGMLLQRPSDDRFTSDPEIPAHFSKKRNLAYLEKSFRSFPAEFLIGLFNAQRDTLEGFWSAGVIDEATAHLYQHALLSDRAGLAEALDNLSFSLLKQRGFRWIKAVSTGYNVNEINRLVTHAGFKVNGSSVILRCIVA